MTTRTQAEIEQDLAAARERLTSHIADLVNEVHPRAVMHRTVDEGKQQVRQTVADGKQRLTDTVSAAKSWLVDTTAYLKAEAKQRLTDEHGWRWDRVAALALTAVAVGGLIGIASRRKH